MQRLIFIGCLAMIAYNDAFDYLRWANNPVNEAQLEYAEKLVTVPQINHAINHRSSEQIAQIYKECLLLKKHKRPIPLDGINFQKIKNDFNALAEIEYQQKSQDLRELFILNSLFFVVSSCTLFYRFYKPISPPIVFASLTCLSMCVMYYAKLAQMHNRSTQSEKMYYHVCELQKLQQDRSPV